MEGTTPRCTNCRESRAMVTPEPIQDYPGFIASLLARGYTRNPHLDHCQETGEHDHLKAPDGHDGIIWADGHVSEFDLTQPARLIYPGGGKRRR